jgi:hypothetical protein
MSDIEKTVLPADLRALVDSFALYRLDDTGEPTPTIEVGSNFIVHYATAFRTYARPQMPITPDEHAGELFSGDEKRELLDNPRIELARRLARLSFEMIAQHTLSMGASIPRDALHFYLEMVERWNVRIADTVGGDDAYFRELNQRLAVLKAHYLEVGNKKTAHAIGRYIWPYVFSHFSE